ncbi:MAG: thermonuclease family protein [Neisseria sp.]|nr:thermonuclease family protein [Neisseria sp.]
MKSSLKMGLGLMLAGCLQAFAAAPPPQSLQENVYAAQVVRVSDGDSLTVRDTHGAQRKIRLAYIDAPELDQAYGQASRRNLATLIERKTVTVEVFSQDKYRRQVAKVTVNGTDVSLRQIHDGAAWHYRSFARSEQAYDDFDAYAAAHSDAEKARRGLWSGKLPVAPWTWRKLYPPQPAAPSQGATAR